MVNGMYQLMRNPGRKLDRQKSIGDDIIKQSRFELPYYLYPTIICTLFSAEVLNSQGPREHIEKAVKRLLFIKQTPFFSFNFHSMGKCIICSV